MEIPQGKPWKIVENRTLKWGSSPPRAEEKTRLPGGRFLVRVEDGKIKEFNCYALLSIMLAQLGVNPDFASAVEAQAAGR